MRSEKNAANTILPDQTESSHSYNLALQSKVQFHKRRFSAKPVLLPVLAVLLLVGLLFAPQPVQAIAGITVTPITTAVVIDSNNSCSATTPQSMFIEVRVNNTTAAPITDLTATISNFTPAPAPAGYSGVWGLGSGANPAHIIGTIPANSYVSTLWYVNYYCYTGS